MAIVGGALMPKIQGIIIDIGGSGVSDTTLMGVSEINFSFILLESLVQLSPHSFHIIKECYLAFSRSLLVTRLFHPNHYYSHATH